MLRLWPEQLTVGLFPGHCWLRRRGKVKELADPTVGSVADLADAFETLLTETAPVRGARIDVIVTDRLARIAALPWQAELRSKPEWEAYARVAFTAIGLPLLDGWVSVPGMRRYGEQGLAYALSGNLLSNLEGAALRRGASLRTVMPLSAAAYWSPRRWMAGAGVCWLLLLEREQAALLSFDGRRCIAYDSQPANDLRGIRQLLQRQLLQGSPSRVAQWRGGSVQPIAELEAMVPEAAVHVLPADYWDRHA